MPESANDIVLTIVPTAATTKPLPVTVKEIQDMITLIKNVQRKKQIHTWGFQVGIVVLQLFLMGTSLTLYLVSENKNATEDSSNSNFDWFKISGTTIAFFTIALAIATLIKGEQINRRYQESPFSIEEKNSIDDICKRLNLKDVDHQTPIKDLLANLNNEFTKAEKIRHEKSERRQNFLLGRGDKNSFSFNFFAKDGSHNMTMKIFEYAEIKPENIQLLTTPKPRQ